MLDQNTVVNTVSLITDELELCEKIINDLIPDSGVDILASDLISASIKDVNKFSEAHTLDYIKACDQVHAHLKIAYELSIKLSTGSFDVNNFTDDGIAKIIEDIGAANLSRFSIIRLLKSAFKMVKPSSPQEQLVTNTYKVAYQIFSDLSIFVRKAKPKGTFPAVEKLPEMSTLK